MQLTDLKTLLHLSREKTDTDYSILRVAAEPMIRMSER